MSTANLAIHLDLVGGLAGDMFVAALVDALPVLQAPVLAAVSALRPTGSSLPVFETRMNAGLRACRFGLPQGYRRIAKEGGHLAAHAPHGTSARAIRERIAAAPLPAATREHALALLAALAEAEAGVHGADVDTVHFHELADWDSVMDLVAAGAIAAELAGAVWSATAPPLGGGQVRTAHGMLPVPTPATAALLTGYRWLDDGVGGERVTPTGAAILRHLVPPERCGGGRVSGRLTGIGVGTGTRTLPGVPNVTRALVFAVEPRAQIHAGDADAVAIIEFDIDDMTGEEIALAAERLRAHAGVLDVSLGGRTGKKGRPMTEMRLLAQPELASAVAQACFAETSTLGLRVREERRHVLRREDVRAQVDGAALTVKLAQRPSGATSGKAAHDDVTGGATLEARRAMRARAVDVALAARAKRGGLVAGATPSVTAAPVAGSAAATPPPALHEDKR